jgi:3-hexulose-6-phosphate synthase
MQKERTKRLMELQLSLDFGNLEDSIYMLDLTSQYIDIVELGTPLIFLEGLTSISVIKKLYPEKKILADLKIVDGGSYETELAFKAGADLVTVLGFASDRTINLAIETANEFKKQIVIDLIGIKQVGHRIQEIDSFGANYVCVHTAIDDQKTKQIPLKDLQIAQSTTTKMGVSVAGGINLTNVQQVLLYQPQIIVVGSGITQQADPTHSAKYIKKAMNDNK